MREPSAIFPIFSPSPSWKGLKIDRSRRFQAPVPVAPKKVCFGAESKEKKGI